MLGAALLALVAGVLALPQVALLLLGIPAAVVGGVATLATAARFLPGNVLHNPRSEGVEDAVGEVFTERE